MFGENFDAMITSVSAGVVTKKIDGEKVKTGIYRIKLQSSNIAYDSIGRFNSSIRAVLQCIEPMPFKAVNFGDQTVMNMNMSLTGLEEEDEAERGIYRELDGEPDAHFKNIKIKNLTVKNDNALPVYLMTIEIPMESDAKFLFRHIKSNVNVKFDKA